MDWSSHNKQESIMDILEEVILDNLNRNNKEHNHTDHTQSYETVTVPLGDL